MRFFLIVALFVVLAFVSAYENPCQQPITIGPCKALMPRWGFDQKTKKCREFGYGGCQGNENNFKTLEECQKTCETK